MGDRREDRGHMSHQHPQSQELERVSTHANGNFEFIRGGSLGGRERLIEFNVLF